MPPRPIDEGRRFADDLRLRHATDALASRSTGMLDLEIDEAEITAPRLVATLHDLGARRTDRLTPEQNAALSAVRATSTIPSELDLRLQENGFDLPQGHRERHSADGPLEPGW